MAVCKCFLIIQNTFLIHTMLMYVFNELGYFTIIRSPPPSGKTSLTSNSSITPGDMRSHRYSSPPTPAKNSLLSSSQKYLPSEHTTSVPSSMTLSDSRHGDYISFGQSSLSSKQLAEEEKPSLIREYRFPEPSSFTETPEIMVRQKVRVCDSSF